MTLGGRLELTARQYPSRTALTFEGRKITYRELDSLSTAFANSLMSLGLQRGGTAAILLNNSPEFVVAYFGIVKAGAAAVPLNTFLTVPEIEYILSDCGAKILVTAPEFNDRTSALTGGIEIISTGDGGAFETPTLYPSMPSFHLPLLAAEAGPKGRTGVGEGAGEDEANLPAAILYTSGTTGKPKGVVLTHNNLLSNAESCIKMFKVTRKDRFLLFLPMFHAFSFMVCLLLPVTIGARVIILKSLKPFSKVIKAVVFGRASFFIAIPPVYNLLSMKRFPRLVLKLLPLRICVSGAAPLSRDTLARWERNHPIPLLEGYGLTEASPVVSCNPLDGARKPGSVGLPLPGVDVRILSDEGAELPSGQVGEIIVRGPNVMKGYLNAPSATAETLKDGWLYTGDLGYIDEDGYIFIVDRKKDLIISHGMNIYPREVEEALYAHPTVRQAAVIGIGDEGRGEVPKAFVSVHEGHAVTEKELKAFLKERLASYKLPRQVVFMDALPTNSTGKILKKELRRLSGLR
ncbi:MAG: long-chain-fatty-acid--CoA ligase [Nitrospirota bacterium]